MKALIIDDEVNVREVIRYLGQWEKYGITDILEASNGEEAKHIIEATKPEIIFTDIKMPKMSGIEMIEWLDSTSYPGKVIFVTGYNDYSFMRQAIKHRSFDYLLKPIEEEPFNHTLAEAVQAWENEQNSHSGQETIDEDFQKLRIEQLVTNACMGEAYKSTDILPYLPLSDQYEMALISFYQMHYAEPYIKALSDELKDRKLGNAFSLQSDRNICVIITIRNEWLTVEEWISQNFDIPVRFVSGRSLSSLSHILDAFQFLQEALDNHQYRSIHKLDELHAARRMKDIVSYVDMYYMEELSLEKLSNLFFFSREHISRKFKQETGLPLSKYMTKLRIQRAKQWLEDTEETIYSISLLLGYQDEKYFSKLFKKVVGLTPFEYRKEKKLTVISR
ncbi:response regulator [Priestia filamentosa]|uniref:DNA-binding response regulator n=1 Tax=Priestia filamentosa TaxID=1402861 RepID=A0A1X7GC02_9BACI|nr:response regulator [Priestia filamentosa]AKO90849.1 DNA-binding response regulator [Priestia filamentosa]AVD54198.1 DNA-binding response regulator [Priestia filamentosa]MDT3765971.1 response regulator [Priestia filamentosa]OXS65553.1 DNA-binding response regulator [Priestia filamentosa]RJS65804.1 DNA-binding response regulator [Priestia filamentosa]